MWTREGGELALDFAARSPPPDASFRAGSAPSRLDTKGIAQCGLHTRPKQTPGSLPWSLSSPIEAGSSANRVYSNSLSAWHTVAAQICTELMNINTSLNENTVIIFKKVTST